MAKRILWLFNHKSLRKFEVPMLLEMGYEVFCPKIWNILDFSADVTYESDDSLTIPKDVLDRLNNVNFYQSISADVMKDLNEYFDVAICMLDYDMLDSLAKSFTGIIGLHAFGLNKTLTYTTYLGNSLLSLLERCGNRFWFLPTYDNLSEAECPFLQRRTLYMPIGLSNATLTNTWVGGDKKILFVCPRIKVNVYYENIYKEFCDNFGDIPHVIGGAQPLPVPDDKTVTGFLSSDQYEYNMNNLAGMFYHNQEPRNLHYHPLEAIKQGMPVIFMAGGMLDHLGGVDFPGRARSIPEARGKIKKLLNGDSSFINSVKQSQVKFLEPFQNSFCRPYWDSGMRKINESLKAREDIQRTVIQKKIAIVMPGAYTGEMLEYTIRFVLNVYRCVKEHGDKVEIVFAYPEEDNYNADEFFAPLKKCGVKIRSYTWKKYTKDKARNVVKLAGYNTDEISTYYYPKYAAMHDGASDFQEFDHIIFTSDIASIGLPFFSLKPFTVIAHDYLQRYVPEAISKKVRDTKYINQRNSNKILVTSEPMARDAIQFAKVSKDKILLTPLLLEVLEHSEIKEFKSDNGEYFLWNTNACQQKNHLRALKSLELYYKNGGDLQCYVCGSNSIYLNPKQDIKKAEIDKKYVLKIRDFIQNSKYVKKHLRFLGYLKKDEYIKTLAYAKFLFHPGYGDNGNSTVVNAAGFKIPSLCSDYPAMRYLSSFTGIPLKYTSPFLVEQMAEDLQDMENNYIKYANELPSLLNLKSHEYSEEAENLYNCLKKYMEI